MNEISRMVRFIASDTVLTLFVDRDERKRYVRKDGPGWCSLRAVSAESFRACWEDLCETDGRQRIAAIR